MNASMTASKGFSSGMTPTISAYRLNANMHIMSRRMSRAKNVAWAVEVEFRALLGRHGLRTSHVEPDFERINEVRFKHHIDLRSKCVVECSRSEIVQVTEELEIALERALHTRPVRIKGIDTYWDPYVPRI